MALVAYDYGSDSAEDEEPIQNDNKTGAIDPTNIRNDNSRTEYIQTGTSTPNIESDISDEEDNIKASSSSNILHMFENLPQKKLAILNEVKTDFEDVVEDFIPKAEVLKKQKGRVKITVPSLSEFETEEDEEPQSKKYKQSVKGSGLLSLLPPVKCIPLSNKSFIPNVLTQKKKPNEPIKKVNKPNTSHHLKEKKQVEVKLKDLESDGSDVEMPETYDEELWQKVCGKKVVKNIIVEQPIVEEPTLDLAKEPVTPYQGLDNAAFKELVGKNKRMPRNIKLIDVNEDELVAEKDLWMTKSLTDPEYIPKPSEDDESLDPTKKKKHHITYLAQRAKANEQELQSQWSSSKHNRMQSRAKYGF